MPPTQRPEHRRHLRRARSIRFSFDHAGERHLAVSTIVSLGGAFLKASHIPRPGTMLDLVERFNPEGAGVRVRCEVVWTCDEPSLERPDTGFGVRFIEASTPADPGVLEDFVIALEPSLRAPAISYEERARGPNAVFRFPELELDPRTYLEPEATFHLADEPAEIDLARELDRLARDRVDASPRPEPLPEPPPAPTMAAPVADKRDRTKKRSVTGIFTALFGRSPKPEPAEAPSPSHPPARAPTHELTLRWDREAIVTRVESMGRQGATLWVEGRAPQVGAALVIEPRGAPAGIGELLVYAVVTAREDRIKAGAVWLAVTIQRVDERGRPGRLRDYLRHVTGQGEA